MTVGFVALWNNTPREFRASESDEWITTERIQAAFAKGRYRGNRTYGLYNCRWSSPWHYLTFWLGPDLQSVTATIADLECAGDFKFADSKHVIGRMVDTHSCVTPGAWDTIPEAREGKTVAALFLSWRHRNGTAPLSPHALALAPALQIQMLGEFDCRWSTSWDRFTFWIASAPEVFERGLGVLEREGAFVGLDTQAVVGTLDRYYRFGNHLQTDLPWLRKEGTAT